MKDWRFKAKVERVVDGDTVDLLVDVGFRVFHRIRARLRNFNAPELRSGDREEAKRGREALASAQSLLPLGFEVEIRTHAHPSIYNSFEVDITLPDGRDFVDAMKELAGKKSIEVSPTELDPT